MVFKEFSLFKKKSNNTTFPKGLWAESLNYKRGKRDDEMVKEELQK